jgi:hypothetical protein
MRGGGSDDVGRDSMRVDDDERVKQRASRSGGLWTLEGQKGCGE